MNAGRASSDYYTDLLHVVAFLECLMDACVEQAETAAAVDVAPALALLRQLRDVDELEAVHAG